METLQLPVSTLSYAYLEDVGWTEYERLLKQTGDRPIRFTYDNGLLEIMTLSFEHEWPKKIIGRLIELLAIVLHVPFCSGGSTTMKRKLKKKRAWNLTIVTGLSTNARCVGKRNWISMLIHRRTSPSRLTCHAVS